MVEDLSAENGAIRSRFPAGMETNSSRQTEPAEPGPCGEPFLDSASAAGGGHLRLCEAGIESFGQWLAVSNGCERPVLRLCGAAIVDGQVDGMRRDPDVAALQSAQGTRR